MLFTLDISLPGAAAPGAELARAAEPAAIGPEGAPEQAFGEHRSLFPAVLAAQQAAKPREQASQQPTLMQGVDQALSRDGGKALPPEAAPLPPALPLGAQGSEKHTLALHSASSAEPDDSAPLLSAGLSVLTEELAPVAENPTTELAPRVVEEGADQSAENPLPLLGHPLAAEARLPSTPLSIDAAGESGLPGVETSLVKTAAKAGEVVVPNQGQAITRAGSAGDAATSASLMTSAPESVEPFLAAAEESGKAPLPTETPAARNASPPPQVAGFAAALRTESAAVPAQRTDFAAAMNARPADPAWAPEVGGRVAMMVSGGQQEASLQLNPPELGRMEIRIVTESDQAKVQFHVHTAAARDALEQAMPRLRDMLEQGGLQLAHSEVADQSASQREQAPASQVVAADVHAEDEPVPDVGAANELVSAAVGLVDQYV